LDQRLVEGVLVVTTEHEAIGDLFRGDPNFAPRILKTLFGRDIPSFARVRVGDSALNQTMSVEFRADVVLELEDEQQIPMLSIVVEVQRDVDVRKEKVWPVYATVQHSKANCATIVLVVATNEDVAKWAATPIDIGWGLTTMRPLVLGPKVIPVITDPAVACADPSLALLSALCHDEGEQAREVVLAAGEALITSPKDLSLELANLMLTVVYNHVRAPLKRAIEAMIMELKFNNRLVEIPPFFEAYVEKGVKQGISQGELKHSRSTLERLVARAGIVLTDEQHKRIEACTDLAMLDRWTDNVSQAKTATDVFGSE
jgi:hypothetical protein